MSDCIEFEGCRDHSGYGRLNTGGRVRRAHRVAWERANGAIPEGMHVLHRCDNPPCVNPDHLFLGTPADNARDRDAKGRGGCGRLPGEANPQAKLTATQVLEIRRRCDAGELQWLIAADYGIHKTLVSQIKNRRIWQEV